MVKLREMNERKIGDTGIFYPEWFWEQGFRFADLMIQVKKGKTKQVAIEIYQKFENVWVTSWRINTIANLVVQVYYKDSLELKEMIEGIYMKSKKLTESSFRNMFTLWTEETMKKWKKT